MTTALNTLPVAAGLGLRSPHIQEVLSTRPDVAWWEVHSENHFGGGAPLAVLRAVRERYPVSLHGVGLGLGSPGPLEARHLDQLAALVAAIEPASVSEHLAWNRYNGQCFNDLLPVPRLAGALDQLIRNIDTVQNRLKRPILLENVSSYVVFEQEDMTEAALLAELVARTGCGILLDVNNLYVNTLNHGVDPLEEIRRLPLHAVGEIHIAGHERFDDVVIDTHGAPVCAAVWQLLDATLALTGPRPVLLERDTHIPPLTGLLDEYAQVAAHLAAALPVQAEAA
ncbi:MNIO family bufferin maturase [Silvimonas iriomotensis]|uniref:UPF0276 protein n=1 Tax=Silvimonas iriomotensis TaxID=449662 RepID=A0ABQ2P7W6_9NEIS|nr:DUF692 domain-containing protein [Silvimonas iriomotensis]GGP20159.1 UPF0276 protein [Silvimonas iriomotensis]